MPQIGKLKSRKKSPNIKKDNLKIPVVIPVSPADQKKIDSLKTPMPANVHTPPTLLRKRKKITPKKRNTKK